MKALRRARDASADAAAVFDRLRRLSWKKCWGPRQLVWSRTQCGSYVIFLGLFSSCMEGSQTKRVNESTLPDFVRSTRIGEGDASQAAASGVGSGSYIDWRYAAGEGGIARSSGRGGVGDHEIRGLGAGRNRQPDGGGTN